MSNERPVCLGTTNKEGNNRRCAGRGKWRESDECRERRKTIRDQTRRRCDNRRDKRGGDDLETKDGDLRKEAVMGNVCTRSLVGGCRVDSPRRGHSLVGLSGV